MKRTYIPFVYLTMVIILLRTPALSQQSSVKILVDGIENDWPSGILEKDTVNGIEKAFLVSDGKLNIFIQIREGFIQNKMLNAGMEIGFDVEGKEKVQQIIQFPMSRLAEMFASGSPMGDIESMRLMALLQAKNFNLKKFAHGNGQYTVGEDNDAGVQIGMSINEKGILIYEASFPLLSLQPKKGVVDISSLGIIVTINGIEPPTQGPSYNASIPSGGRGGRGGGPPSGSGVSAGGGGRNGPGGGVRFGSNDRAGMMKKMSETTHSWSTLKLK